MTRYEQYPGSIDDGPVDGIKRRLVRVSLVAFIEYFCFLAVQTIELGAKIGYF